MLNYLRFYLVYGTVAYIAVGGRAAFKNELDFQCNGLKHQDNLFFPMFRYQILIKFIHLYFYICLIYGYTTNCNASRTFTKHRPSRPWD